MAKSEHGQENPILSDLQKSVDEFIDGQLPRIREFESQIYQLVEQLKSGEITGKEFLDGLQGDGEPVYALLRVQRASGYVENIDVRRIEKGRIRLAASDVGSIPAVSTFLALDDQGNLLTEETALVSYDPDTMEPTTLESDVVVTDTLDVLSGQDLAKDLLDTLLAAKPYNPRRRR